MSLPWFHFYPKPFLTDTIRLSTEEKGAYLMILLDFFEQGEPPPDDDEILARIAGIPLDRWTGRMRAAVASKFEVRDGHWHHSFLEDEIRNGQRRYEQTAKAKDAAAARRGKKSTVTETVTEPKRSPAAVSDTVTASVQPPKRPVEEEEERIEDSANAESIARVANPNIAVLPVTETVVQIGPANAGAETMLPQDFSISITDRIRCQSDGYGGDVVDEILTSFKRYHINAGTMSQDWIASWWRWWERKKPALHPSEKPGKRQAAPRVEVSRKAAKKVRLPDDWQPKAEHAAVAVEEGYTATGALDQLAKHFRDVCEANDYRYANHDAAFRNFIRNQKNFRRGPVNGQARLQQTGAGAAAPAGRGTIVDAGNRAISELDRRIAAAEAAQGGDGGGDAPVRELPAEGLREPGDGAGDDGDGAERVQPGRGGAGDEA